MDTKKKPTNIYYEITGSVYVQPDKDEKDPHRQRLVLKIHHEGQDQYVGLELWSLHMVDDLIEVLEKCRNEMDKPSNVHPKLKSNNTPDTKH